MSRGQLSADRWARLYKTAIENLQGDEKMLENEVMVDGRPAFTYPATPRQQYDKLVAMQQAGDPKFFSDPSAQAELAKLAMQFGPPPPQIAEPYGGAMPPQGAQTLAPGYQQVSP